MSAHQKRSASTDEILLRGQRRALELIAGGRPLGEVLDSLCRCVEEAVAGTLCSVLLLDPSGKRVQSAAGPSLPEEYCRLIDGEPIGPRAGSCGTAAYRKETVIVEDVSADPLWTDYRSVAETFGLFACASTPIFGGPQRAVLGTFAIYHTKPGPFSEMELALLDSMQDLAAIAITNDGRERALQRAQKDESLALLAGGVAHDFNNLLAVVTARVSLLRVRLAGREEVELLDDVALAADRAADLTRQLVAYSGRTSVELEPIDLNALIEEIGRLIKATLTKKAKLELQLMSGLPPVLGDATRLQQVVLNLLTNASEAIGDGDGDILIRTGTALLDGSEAPPLFGGPLPPGRYVTLEVVDTGCGMPPEVASNVFEPFFTTKESGRGLGLAALVGIVRTHDGSVQLKSEPDRGTRFTLFFPALDAYDARIPRADDIGAATGGGLRVLLVDDEEAILDAAKGLLEALGHEVTTANDGIEAIARLEDEGADLDLVLMDLRMPQMGGFEALRVIRERWPTLAVILSSGDPKEEELSNAEVEVRLLPKPYDIEALRKVLSGVPRRSPR